jgi:hypothetical protein
MKSRTNGANFGKALGIAVQAAGMRKTFTTEGTEGTEGEGRTQSCSEITRGQWMENGRPSPSGRGYKTAR